MENLVLYCLRLQSGYSPDQMAECLGIDIRMYLDIEQGTGELTTQQQTQLSKIFKVDPQILKAALLQTKLLRTGDKLINRQEWVINMLTALVHELVRPPQKQNTK